MDLDLHGNETRWTRRPGVDGRCNLEPGCVRTAHLAIGPRRATTWDPVLLPCEHRLVLALAVVQGVQNVPFALVGGCSCAGVAWNVVGFRSLVVGTYVPTEWLAVFGCAHGSNGGRRRRRRRCRGHAESRARTLEAATGESIRVIEGLG
jgi:hypothetical protein